MQLGFHQLDRRGEHLRARHPARQRRLLASLATSGQQTPIDTVEELLWPMSEAEVRERLLAAPELFSKRNGERRRRRGHNRPPSSVIWRWPPPFCGVYAAGCGKRYRR